MSAGTLWSELLREVDRRILKALRDWRQDLAKTTGVVPGERLPVTGPAAPGGTGTGYPAKPHATSHESGGSDPLALGSIAGTLTDSQHGSRGGGSLHSAATTSTAGFQSAADKMKEDAYPAVSGLTTGHVLTATGASAIAFQAPPATGAPANAQYVTMALDSTLSAERVLTAGTGITITDGGANGNVTIAASGSEIGQYVQGTAPGSPATGAVWLDTSAAAPNYMTNPMTTEGDLIRGGASGAPTRVAVGGSGTYLRSDGTDPAWATFDVGDIAAQNAHRALMGPPTGSAAAPTFRLLVAGDLPATAVTAGTYGAADKVGTFIVDAEGRLTGATDVAIALAASAITSGALAVARGGTGVGAIPAFSAWLSSNQTISNATFTKLQCATETFDTNNNYDSTTNYRFTPTVAGTYLFTANAVYLSTLVDQKIHAIFLYKNGSRSYVIEGSTITSGTADHRAVMAGIIAANGSTDYFELYTYHEKGSNADVWSGGGSFSAIWVGP